MFMCSHCTAKSKPVGSHVFEITCFILNALKIIKFPFVFVDQSQYCFPISTKFIFLSTEALRGFLGLVVNNTDLLMIISISDMGLIPA